jgi:hypothetical protein
MGVKELWDLVLSGEAVAITPNGSSVTGADAHSYSMYSEWKIVLDYGKTVYIKDGYIESEE